MIYFELQKRIRVGHATRIARFRSIEEASRGAADVAAIPRENWIPYEYGSFDPSGSLREAIETIHECQRRGIPTAAEDAPLEVWRYWLDDSPEWRDALGRPSLRCARVTS